MANNADANIRVTADTSKATKSLNDLTKSVGSLNEVLGGIKPANLSSLSTDIDKITKSIKEMAIAQKELGDLKLLSDKSLGKEQLLNLKEQINLTKELGAVSTQNLEKESSALSNMVRLRADVRNSIKQEIELEKIRGQNIDANMKKYEQHVIAQQGLYNSLNNREANMRGGFAQRVMNSGAYISGYAGFSLATSGLREGLSAIKDYELGVVDLRRTLDQGQQSFSQYEASLRNFGRFAIENAKDFGVSIKETQDAMTELARAGVTQKELGISAKNVLMGLNTTELGSAEEVVSALVSTTKQLKMDMKDSGMILDSWNMLADKYAVHTDDFAHAIERSGSASKMLGMDLYDLNAVVTILGENTQASGEQVGTAFKSLSARLLRDGTVEKLKSYGIEVKKNKDEFLDFRSIMKNINEVIKDLPENSVMLSDIMDTLGGAWRKNWITALVKDFDRFDDLVKQQAESVGYSERENTKAMDTIEKKAQRLKQTFLEAFIDIGEDGNFTQGIKNNLDSITEALEKVINSPTIRKFAKFMGGNPLEALGVTGGWVLFSKLSKNGNPLYSMFNLLNNNISKEGTLGGLINSLNSRVGFNGKQNRAAKLYEDMQKTYKLTNTEMLPVAEKIDNIFNSNTRGIASRRAELEKLNAQLADSTKRLKHLSRENAVDEYINAPALKGLPEKERADMYKDDLKEEISHRKQLTDAIKDQEIAISSYQKQSEKSGSISGKLRAAFSKQNLLSFAGGLASAGAQMIAIAAIAKGLDYAINRKKNIENNYNNAVKKLEEQRAEIKQQQELVEDLKNSSFEGRSRLVGYGGKNLGLTNQEFNEFNSQLKQLKDISPEVASAIEDSARTLGTYAGAASVAAKKLAELNREKARTFLKENGKDLKKRLDDLNSFHEEKDLYFGSIHGVKLKKATDSIFKDLNIGSLTDDKNILSDLKKVRAKKDAIRKFLLEDKELDKKTVDKFFDMVDESWSNAKERGDVVRQLGTYEFAKNLDEDVVEQVQKELEQRNKKNGTNFNFGSFVEQSLDKLLSTAENEKMTDAFAKFSEKLGRQGKEALMRFGDLMTMDGSKTSMKTMAESIKNYLEDAVKEGLVSEEDSESLRQGLYQSIFGQTFDDYEKIVSNFNDRISRNKIDMKQAFGIDNIEDATRAQFDNITDSMNRLQFALENGSGVAKRIKSDLQDGFFSDMDFSEFKLAPFLEMSEKDYSRVTSVFSDIAASVRSSSSEVQSAFAENKEQILMQLAELGDVNIDNFSEKLSTLFSGLHISSDELRLQIAESINEAMNLGLSEKEIRVKLGIDPQPEGAAEAGANAKNEAQGVVDSDPVKVDAQAKEGAGQQIGEQIGEEAQASLNDIKINAESLTSQLGSLNNDDFFKGEKEIEIKFKINNEASSIVESFIRQAEGQIAGLEQKIQTVLSSSGAVKQNTNAAVSNIETLAGKVAGVQQNLNKLRQPVKISVNAGELNKIKSHSKGATAGLQTIADKIKQVSADFAAGCNRMVSAWASMSFPRPYVPSPHITVTIGLGTYDMNIAWYAKGGIIPATRGGRIVGVAEGGEDEAIVPISKLKDYVKSSMTDVLSDAMADFAEISKKSWEDLSVNYNTVTSNGYFATKIEMPYLELSDESKKALDSFVNKEIDFSGYDPKNIQSVINVITGGSRTIDNKLSDLDAKIKMYDAMGDKSEKLRLSAEKYNLQVDKTNKLHAEANRLLAERNALQARSNFDFSQYLDGNLELNYLYQKQMDIYGEKENEAKKSFDNTVKAGQAYMKAIKKIQDEIMKNNADMAKQMQDQATSLLKKRIESQYKAQEDYFAHKKEKIEREKKLYDKEIREQNKKLDKAKKSFDEEMSRKTKVIDDQIKKLKDDRKAKDDAEKLDKLKKEIKEAEDKLRGVEATYNTKVYSMDKDGNWQFTYEANPDDLEKAKDKLKKAQEDLANYKEDKEIEKLQKQKDALNEEKRIYSEHYSKLKDKLAEQQEMRKEAYDEEIEILKNHLKEVNDMKKSALENVSHLAKQFVNSILAHFNFDTKKAFEYMNIAQGNYGNEAYNPLSRVFKNDYVKQLEAAGKNIEEYTNKLLNIVKNPEGVAPYVVREAYEELKRLGTTGAVDVNGFSFSKEAREFAAKQGFASMNEFILSNINRIGQVREFDSGLDDPNRKRGNVITAEHMADWFNKLGINVDAITLSNLKSNLIRGEVGFDGTVLNSPMARMRGYGSDFVFDKEKQGLLTDKWLNDIYGAVMSFDGTNKTLYDLTGALRTKDANDLNIAGNVVFHQIAQRELWKGFANKSLEHNQLMEQRLTSIVGKMDANEYFSKKASRNSDLRYAMDIGKFASVNEFILRNMERIGTVRTSGANAGTTVTKEDMFSWFKKLGIDERLVYNTIKVADSNDDVKKGLLYNGEITGANTTALRALSGDGKALGSALMLNNKSQINLSKNMENLPVAIQKILSNLNIGSGSGSGTSPIQPPVDDGSGGEKPKPDSGSSGGNDSTSSLSALIEEGNRILSNSTHEPLKYAVQTIGNGSLFELVRKSVARTDKPKESIDNWLNLDLWISRDYIKKVRDYYGYSKGGIIDYTGIAPFHGSPNAPEVVFNATDAKKLYDMIHNMDFTAINMPKIRGLNVGEALSNINIEKSGNTTKIDKVELNLPNVVDGEDVKRAIINLPDEIGIYYK